MDYRAGPMLTGILIWTGIVALSLLVLLLVALLRRHRDPTNKDVVIAALVSDVLIHLLASSDPGFLAYSLVSFPLVGLVCWTACLSTRWVYRRMVLARPGR